jgi:hypothetical protein
MSLRGGLALIVFGFTAACVTPAESARKPEPAKAQAPHLAKDVPTVSPETVRQSYLKHAAMTQFHRWFLVYEHDSVPIENALDLLDPAIRVKSGLGEAKGPSAYRERVAALPKAWENGHQLKSADFTVNADGTIALKANIAYTNQGMLPDGAVRSSDLTYVTTLKPSDAFLPRFSDIEIVQNAQSKGTGFVSLYPENRMRSLVHYWLALIENPKRDAELFREILADGFALNFSSGKIDTFDKFKAWYTGPASSVGFTRHTIRSMKVTPLAGDTYAIDMQFDWQGVLPDGSEMVARTQHNWTVTDNPKDRFAKVKTVDVALLVPFQPKPRP